MLDIPMDTIGGRLRYVRLSPEAGKKTLNEMSETLGISRAQLLTYELNKVVPSDAIMQLFCLKYNVDFKWLRDGEGYSPFVEHEDEESRIDQLMAGQSETAKIIMAEALRVLDDHAWQKIGEMIQSVARRLDEKKERE